MPAIARMARSYRGIISFRQARGCSRRSGPCPRISVGALTFQVECTGGGYCAAAVPVGTNSAARDFADKVRSYGSHSSRLGYGVAMRRGVSAGVQGSRSSGFIRDPAGRPVPRLSRTESAPTRYICTRDGPHPNPLPGGEGTVRRRMKS